MGYSRKIHEKLAKTEESFRELGASAFRDGDDTGAELARVIVNTLKSLKNDLDTSYSSDGAVDSVSQRPNHLTSKKTSRRQKGKAKSGSDYPRYEIRNETLIRIGWSKKKKSEYEHKTSREAYTQVVESIASLSSVSTAPYTAEKVIEQTAELGHHIPSYQIYIVIGLLKDRGCLFQVAKGEYSLASDFARQAEELWSSLAKGGV